MMYVYVSYHAAVKDSRTVIEFSDANEMFEHYFNQPASHYTERLFIIREGKTLEILMPRKK
jgi:hypothetical protein